MWVCPCTLFYLLQRHAARFRHLQRYAPRRLAHTVHRRRKRRRQCNHTSMRRFFACVSTGLMKLDAFGRPDGHVAAIRRQMRRPTADLPNAKNATPCYMIFASKWDKVRSKRLTKIIIIHPTTRISRFRRANGWRQKAHAFIYPPMPCFGQMSMLPVAADAATASARFKNVCNTRKPDSFEMDLSESGCRSVKTIRLAVLSMNSLPPGGHP